MFGERSERSKRDEPDRRFKFRCRDRYAKIYREVIRGKRREVCEVRYNQGPRCMVSWFIDRSFLLFFVLLTLCTAILSRPSLALRSFCLPAHEKERDSKGTKKDRAFVSGMCRDRVEISRKSRPRRRRVTTFEFNFLDRRNKDLCATDGEIRLSPDCQLKTLG